MIRVSNLTKKYSSTIAVDDISFEINKNEVVGFLGPNGAGKSTTLKILTCYLCATSGKVEIDNKNVEIVPEEVKKIVGYLPENVPLYPEMRVHEYLNYRAGIKGVSSSKRKSSVKKALESCRIEDVKNKLIGQLSKGYRQRVGIADALVADPLVLILDEPTIGLDPNQIRDVRELIKELGKEKTVILSSHILPEVEAVCSRVIIINKGKIVGQGKPKELREKIGSNQSSIYIELLDKNNIAAEKLSSLGGEIKIIKQTQNGYLELFFENKTSSDLREKIFDTAVFNNFKILSMSQAKHSLEDIFTTITTKENMDEPQDKKADLLEAKEVKE